MPFEDLSPEVVRFCTHELRVSAEELSNTHLRERLSIIDKAYRDAETPEITQRNAALQREIDLFRSSQNEDIAGFQGCVILTLGSFAVTAIAIVLFIKGCVWAIS